MMREKLNRCTLFGMRPWQAFSPMKNLENQKQAIMNFIIILAV